MGPNDTTERDTTVLVECVATREIPAKFEKALEVQVIPECPWYKASWISRTTFNWVTPLIKLGEKQPLSAGDVWKIRDEYTCSRIYEKYGSYWEEEQKRPDPSFSRMLFRAFRLRLFYSFLLFVLQLILLVAQPYLVQWLLAFLRDQSGEAEVVMGYGLAVSLALSSFFGALCLSHGFDITTNIGLNMRSLIMDLVYRKSLKLSATARQATETGEIITLMSVDSERVSEGINLMHRIWFAPAAMTVSLILIGVELDAFSAICSGSVMVAVLVIAIGIAKCVGRLRGRILRVTEERIKVTSEILQGIRVLKFYAWEEPMLKKIEKIRLQELAMLKRFQFLRIYNTVLLVMAPVISTFVCFIAYDLLGNELSISKVFTVLAFIGFSSFSAYILPQSLAAFSEAMIAMNRIGFFLSMDELEEKTIPDSDYVGKAKISMQSASFSWSKDCSKAIPALCNVNVEIKPGSLVMVIGSVGSGKSSFLSAILGEMHQSSGKSTVYGKIAYASQDPWIRNVSVKENILFEEDYDPRRYYRVLQATQLTSDLKHLANGDQTEIGERGMNLSGGQKARVSLARALYRKDTEIYVLDDPLSAVDVHVAKGIFEQCVLGMMAKTTRVLVLNSHHHFLKYADHILIMERGRILKEGTYRSLAQENIEHFFSHIDPAHGDHDDTYKEHCANTHGVNSVLEYNEDVYNANSLTPTTGLVQAEDRETGAVSLSIYSKYFQQAGVNGKFLLSFIAVIFGVAQAFRVMSDWWLGQWAQQPLETYMYCRLIYVTLFALAMIITFGRSFLLICSCLRSSQNMHQFLFRKVLNAPVNLFFDVTPVGRILNRFSRDLDLLDSDLPDCFNNLVHYLTVFIGVLVIIAVSSPWIVVLYAPIIAVFVSTKNSYQISSREIKRLDGITRTPIFNSFSETLNGLHSIRAFSMGDFFIKKNQDAVDHNAAFVYSFAVAGRWLSFRLDLLSAFVVCAINVFLVISKGSFSDSVAGLALVYSLRLTTGLQYMVRVATITENAMTGVERLFHYEKLEAEAPSEIDETYPGEQWPKEGAIKIQGLSLRYRPGLNHILKDVSLDILPRQKIGVCGRSGAGKSSLVMALFRIAEFDTGRILIDGVDISQIGLKTLRSKLSIIPQDPVLFSGNLRQNLDPNGDYDDMTIWTTLEQVNLKDYIMQNCPGGLSTTVSEKGGNISVGQRQLLCIGRALLRNSRIIVMDEATASVDTATDKLIQETIKKAFKAQTVITIAHRLETIKDYDRVVVLEAGKVKEFDSPRVLMVKEKSLFRALALEAGLVKE